MTRYYPAAVKTTESDILDQLLTSSLSTGDLGLPLNLLEDTNLIAPYTTIAFVSSSSLI